METGENSDKGLVADTQHSVLVASLGIVLECPIRFSHDPDVFFGNLGYPCRFDQLRDALKRYSSVLHGRFSPFIIVSVNESGFDTVKTLRFLEVSFDVI